MLTGAGKGVSEYTVREIANIAYFLITEKFEQPTTEDGKTIQEQLEIFEERIWQRVPAEYKAEKALRERLIAMGVDPDAKPELSPELAAKLKQDEILMKSDEELFFSGDLHSGKEMRGKKLRPKDSDFG